MADVTMTRSQYEALLGLADSIFSVDVRKLRDAIDAANGVVRYQVLVRWQDVGGKYPPRIDLGLGWPQQLSGKLELERPISKEDVLDFLASRANNPVSVMVTTDEDGVVGWTELDEFDFVAAAR